MRGDWHNDNHFQKNELITHFQPCWILDYCWATINGFVSNRHISQIPQCIRQLSHNAPFCDMCAHFCYEMVHCGNLPNALWNLWDGSNVYSYKAGYNIELTPSLLIFFLKRKKVKVYLHIHIHNFSYIYTVHVVEILPPRSQGSVYYACLRAWLLQWL